MILFMATHRPVLPVCNPADSKYPVLQLYLWSWKQTDVRVDVRVDTSATFSISLYVIIERVLIKKGQTKQDGV